MSTTPKRHIFDSNAAAAYLGLKPDTIRKYVQRGVLWPSGTVGLSYFFEREELDRFQQSRKRSGRPKS
jgi:hypothetical protein